MAEPLLRRLQARGERVTVAALPWVAPLYRFMPEAAEVIELPFAHGGLQWRARRQLARELRGRFDCAYVCPNSFKSALLPWLAGIPRRVGYLGEARVGLLTHRIKNPPRQNRPPMVAFYSALSGAGAAQATGDRPRLRLAPADALAVTQTFGLVPQAYYVLAPGAEYGPAKRWPCERFAELATRLDGPAVLIGSVKEQALCVEIAQRSERSAQGCCINLAGRTSLAQAIALIASARAVVSNDSGLMHVAAALGVHQIALFGSSSPLHTPPLNDRAHILWLKDQLDYAPPLDCAPCFERTCPLGHTRCLADITVAQVLAKL